MASSCTSKLWTSILENVDTREYLGEGYVTVGQLDLARLELSEIEKRCGTTCEEYQELYKVLQSATSIKP
ncbi:MAG TPA: hypothetical protein VFJ49_02370 [Methyloceanibacter sp.]|nr:hypothetical protein [Methyloceanibacter sp.]